MSKPIYGMHSSGDMLLATSSTAISLGNAIVIAMTEKLLDKGVLSKPEAQGLVLEIVELVRQGTDNPKSLHVADMLCHDLEEFAAGLKE
ncbi:hypothetical protein PMI07_002069 [Rhizobium sp. CF080]|nr:hypothetical protein PMI07_002069 [Rhizobium sp. CF080]